MPQFADDATMEDLTRGVAQAPGEQVSRIETLLLAYPDDARLHFLRGSILIGEKRFIEAHQSLSRAVALAPDFAIARFQLGFFQLTSGEADAALETWGRLDRLPDAHYLRKFVDGLRCLVRDDFTGAIGALSEGIALNHENPPLSRDMTLLIEKCREHIAQRGEQDGEPISATALLLRQFPPREH
jgi:tetratricopeptide (TPR) repeat protein